MATSTGGPQSPAERDVIVALMLLREAVLTLPQAIALNMQGGTAQPADDPRAEKSPLQKSLSSLAQSIKGPLLALSTYLSTTTSGFSLFSSALKVFATAVAPIVLPLFFSLAAGLTALSDVLFKKIGPVLGKFFDAVFAVLIPAVNAIVKAFEWLATMVGKIGRAIGSVLPDVPRHRPDERPSDYYRRLRTEEGRSRGGALLATMGESVRTTLSGLGTASPETGAAIKDTLRELAMSIGPKGSTGSVSSIYSRAQQAAMNMTPYETRMLMMAQEVLNKLSVSAGAYTDTAAGGDLEALRRIMAGGR